MARTKSFWHYERTELTSRIVRSIELELVQSLTLFAPRRIGKTEFLEFDLKPALETADYKVLYFSFFAEDDNMVKQFTNFLYKNIKKSVFEKLSIKEIDLSWCKINLTKNNSDDYSILDLLSLLAIQAQKEGNKKLVLLLDEIQELQYTASGNKFIAGLRTALDLNKNQINVIFTGSSQDGLRRMFSDKRAPFFHFGMNIEMQKFGKEFTDFLSDRLHERSKSPINKDKLFDIFCKLDRITEYIRHIINQLALEPELSLDDVYNNYIAELYNVEKIEVVWNNLSQHEQGIYLWLKANKNTFYTNEFRAFLAKECKIAKITNGQIQYALAKLLKSQHIAQDEAGKYQLNNQFLTKWLDSNAMQ